jgi:hypothetical protein
MSTTLNDHDPSSAAPCDLDQVRRIGLDARAELPPAYLEVLRGLPQGARLAQGFALWRAARDALVRQGLRRGLTEDAARAEAARRMLALHDDPSA